MKKIILTSLLAVFAATSANAAINDNPMYRPDQGRFYSVTELNSHTEDIDSWKVTEKFGYGITDQASIYINTDLYEYNSFDHYGWGNFEIGADYRLLNDMNWKVDAYGSYALAPVWGAEFLDSNATTYTWGVGVRAGYVTDLWTVAGHVEFNNQHGPTNCYAKDSVVEGNNKVGGILGEIRDGPIRFNSTNAKVTAITSKAGGIAGYFENTDMTAQY